MSWHWNNTFSLKTELLDSFSQKGLIDLLSDNHHDKIGFGAANFVWSSDTNGSLTPSKRGFVLRIAEELIFERGRINLIIGPTGSGKTSLLMALLGRSYLLGISDISYMPF
jgi:AAA15 family ATPase/GTPase